MMDCVEQLVFMVQEWVREWVMDVWMGWQLLRM